MRFLGNLLIIASVFFLFFIFGPTLKEEIKYRFNQASHVKYSLESDIDGTFEKVLTPPNKDFSIVIPKIAAVAPIIANVDSQDKSEYLKALKRGVAHAEGTAIPGADGNVYLFAHSTDSFLNVGRYNAIFYLIGKLEMDDEIDIFYKGRLIKYKVFEKKVVGPEDVKYLGVLEEEKTLTLQTCYPPGTNLKRLIVIAKQVEN